MMKKLFSFFMLLMMVSVVSFGQQVNKQDALMKAQRFKAQKMFATGMQTAPVDHISMKLAYTAQSNSDDNRNHFYVFNSGNDAGFVIVSGEDSTSEILAYSDSGQFDYEQLPDNMRWWLEEYSREIEYLINNASDKASTPVPSATGNISPLLGGTLWNQESPYNNLCPAYNTQTKCATGCVATAMAQIMYYHRWPEVGEGSHSYMPGILYGGTLSADFGNTYYQWDAMTPTYHANSSAEARNAVATLMLHCGVSVEMVYSAQSGALCEDCCYAFTNYFRYDPGITYKYRSYYTAKQWEEMMRNELDNHRPIFYTGRASDGRHAFVCDGYDGNYFHINWGWGGLANGWFLSTALTPATQGVGGSSGGFNYNQEMIIGIQPLTSNPTETIEMITTEKLIAGSKEIEPGNAITFTLRGKLRNVGWKTVSCDLGMAVYNMSGEEVYDVVGKTDISLTRNEEYYGFSFGSIALPSLESGFYEIFPVCRLSGTAEWTKINPTYSGLPNNLIMEVTESSIKFTAPGAHSLEATNIQIETPLYDGIGSIINATVMNRGELEYYGEIQLILLNETTYAQVSIGTKYLVGISPEESVTVDFTDTFYANAGNYLLAVINEDYTIISDYTPVTVLQAPVQYASISMAAPIDIPNIDNVPQNDVQVTARIHCSEGVYAGNIYAYICLANNTIIGCLDPVFVFIETDETKEITFSGAFEAGTPGETYYMYLTNGNTGVGLSPTENARREFTLANPTGMKSVQANDTKVYPQVVNDILNIESESPMRRIRLVSLTGSLVLDRPCRGEKVLTTSLQGILPGKYLLVIDSNDKNSSHLIIKQ